MCSLLTGVKVPMAMDANGDASIGSTGPSVLVAVKLLENPAVDEMVLG